jgi:hypothetical protein
MDALDSDNLEEGEIDWVAIRAWKGGDAPAFAGRYLLGTPNQQEVDLGYGFCLWAHGEGTDPNTPMTVAPIQRSDPDRQATIGTLGSKFGGEDALAIATYIQRCADVGDLVLPMGAYVVLVYLEVEADTNLSFDYWATWAHTIEATLLNAQPQGLVRPLLPAIACAFEQADLLEPVWPAEPVQACLTYPAPPGQSPLCHAFWCLTVFDDPEFGVFVQDFVEGPIPIRYRRTFDGPGGTPVPDSTPSAVLQTLEFIAIDEIVDSGDPTQYTLETALWDPAAPPPLDPAIPWDPAAPPPLDTTSLPPNLPTQLGIDTAYRREPPTPDSERRTIVQCMATKQIVVRRLPAGFGTLNLGTDVSDTDVPPARPTFAARYLPKPSTALPERGHFNGLTRTEAIDLAAAGFEVCSIWQLGRVMTNGSDHAKDAFAAAAEIGQPPYTPVYFAVDLSVGGATVGSPPLSQVVTYFHDVRSGYLEYLADGGTVPYYIGCYAAHNVLDAIYRAGLATHFWQPWPFDWGPPSPIPSDWRVRAPGWRAWRHLNFWQVLLENGQAELLDLNAEILGRPPHGPGCTPVLDFDVAWGDPGSWVPT